MSSQYGSIFSFAKNLAQQQAAEPDDNYGMGPGWQAINSAPIDPNKPAFRPSPASVDPYGSGPLPDNFGNQTQRLISTGYPNTVAPIGLMPLYGGPQLNAVTHSVATQVVKEAIAAIPSTPATIVFNGVNEQTGNYTAQASDSGKLISFDITSPATLTLPATSPGDEWFTSVENNGSAMLAINPNGLELDYLSNSIILGPGQGVALYSDGTNYFTQRGLSDGLIHGETPTPTDPAAIVLQDDFASGIASAATGVIGSLGWGVIAHQTSAQTYMYCGGGFPYFGEFCIAANNTGTANSGETLILNYGPEANGFSRMRSPFVESPSWKMIWVFRFMPNVIDGFSAGFDLTNRAVYIGLGIEDSSENGLAQRPFNFVGLRFDQDTTAPSIGDTTFKFESLQNGAVAAVNTRTSTNGVNNQGGATFSITSVSCTSNVITVTAANTLQANSMVTFSNMTTSTFLNGVTVNVVSANSTSFTINYTHANFSGTTETGTATLGGSVTDTGMTPTIGKYYRFEMTCSTVGQVNMSLSDGTTTFTATGITVPQYSFNLKSTWAFGNNFTGEFYAQSGPIAGPFGTGSVLTFSNFTSTAAVYNGPQTVSDSDVTVLRFFTSTATGSLTSQTGTIAGYPSHFIQASFGTTTSGTGTADCALHIDFFGFAWNPVLGNGGAPNSVKPRFW